MRWCFSDATARYDNAFWDGTQMVFGTGYAAADDVVGHELTHGFVERTSNSSTCTRAARINESHRRHDRRDRRPPQPGPTESDADWMIGEDLPARGAAQHEGPDPLRPARPDDQPHLRDRRLDDDNGAVHHNDGVGNKTAYLISQGGTFNGQTITGIDAGDPGLAKTGRLYLETIMRLTSGAEYADLGRRAGHHLRRARGPGTGGFTAADCDAVARRRGHRAGAAADGPDRRDAEAAALRDRRTRGRCSSGTTTPARLRLRSRTGALAAHAGQRHPDVRRRAATSSWFGWDPDPTSTATPQPDRRPAALRGAGRRSRRTCTSTTPTSSSAPSGAPGQYYDGGQVLVQTLARHLDDPHRSAVGQRARRALRRHREPRSSAVTATATAPAGST